MAQMNLYLAFRYSKTLGQWEAYSITNIAENVMMNAETEETVKDAILSLRESGKSSGLNPSFESLIYHKGLKYAPVFNGALIKETVTITATGEILAERQTNFAETYADITTTFYARSFTLSGVSLKTTANTETVRQSFGDLTVM